MMKLPGRRALVGANTPTVVRAGRNAIASTGSETMAARPRGRVSACVGTLVLAVTLASTGLSCAGSGGPAEHAASASEPAAVQTPVWQVRGSGGLVPIEPGTDDPALLSAEACAECHEAEHRDWLVSRHALAWTNGIFQREFRQTPRTWCIHCHAPLSPQVAAVKGTAKATDGKASTLADDGVGCAACHVRAGRIVARVRHADSPHNTLIADDFGSPEFCADCHQFNFSVFGPGGEVVRSSHHPMQATVAQFRAALAAGRVPRAPRPTDAPSFGSSSGASGTLVDRDPARGGCRSCHAQGATGHDYRGAHDPAMLERALAFTHCRDGDSVVITVENRGAGHNVPTGDIHRHIAVRAWRSSAPERLFDGFLGRRFSPDPDGGKRTTWDSTLTPGERRRYRIALHDLGGTPDEPIRFELRYVYIRDEHPRRDPGEPAFRVVDEDRVSAHEMTPCPR